MAPVPEYLTFGRADSEAVGSGHPDTPEPPAEGQQAFAAAAGPRFEVLSAPVPLSWCSATSTEALGQFAVIAKY